jgi:hypothetical protein
MSDKDSQAHDAPASPPPLADAPPPAPPAPSAEEQKPDEEQKSDEEQKPAEQLEPTIRDHAERLQLAPWKVEAVVRRLHGTHDEDGERVFEKGVSHNTRMTEAEFDAALELALHGRV